MKPVKVLLLAVLLIPFLSRAQQLTAVTSTGNNSVKAEKALVRGVSFEDFKSSVTDFADAAKEPLAQQAWNLWKTEQWAELEKFFTDNNLNGGWPPNRGAVNLKIVTLKQGLVIDRYGGYYDTDSVFQDKGTFVSAKDVPFAKRALPDKTLNSPYRVYKITKPIANVREGKIIPWFGKEGLGIQYELPYTVNDLKKEGYLQEEKQ